MAIIEKLKEVSATIYQRIKEDAQLENLNNPYDYYGAVHNKGMDYISERLSLIVVPNYIINTQCNKHCIGIDFAETEQRLAKHIDVFIREAAIGKPIEIPDIRPVGLSLIGILRSVPEDIIEQVYLDGKLTLLQKNIIVLYLTESKRIFPDIVSFIKMSIEFENHVVKSDQLSEKEKEVVLKTIAIGKYSGYYTFRIQANPRSPWNPGNSTWFPGDGSVAKINWWKVLACDCVGGCVGGPAGYIGASACSTIGQM